MGLAIKIIFSIIPVVVFLASMYVMTRSGIVVYKIWTQGIDVKSTRQNIFRNLTAKMNMIILINKMALYKDGDIVGLTRYEPATSGDGVLFSDVFAEGEASALKALKIGDIFEFRNKKYKIIDIGGGMTGTFGSRHFDLVRRIKAEKQ